MWALHIVFRCKEITIDKQNALQKFSEDVKHV